MAEEIKILTIKVSITVNCTFQPCWEKIQQVHMHREGRVAVALYRAENKAQHTLEQCAAAKHGHSRHLTCVQVHEMKAQGVLQKLSEILLKFHFIINM